MANNNHNGKKYSFGIIVLLFSIICVITLFILWIPHFHLPSKEIIASNNSIRHEDSTDGSINSENIWNDYYGKTPSEVIRFAPKFVSFDENIYLLDSGIIDGYPTLPTNLIGIFEDGKLAMLSLLFHMSDGSVCFMKCRDSLSCIDEKALEQIGALSVLYMHQFGLVSEDEHEIDSDRSHAENTGGGKDYITFTLQSGINCVAPTCPGSTVSLICGAKDGDSLYKEAKLISMYVDN